MYKTNESGNYAFYTRNGLPTQHLPVNTHFSRHSSRVILVHEPFLNTLQIKPSTVLCFLIISCKDYQICHLIELLDYDLYVINGIVTAWL